MIIELPHLLYFVGNSTRHWRVAKHHSSSQRSLVAVARKLLIYRPLFAGVFMAGPM